MKSALTAFLIGIALSGAARAAEAVAASTETVALAGYFLKVPTADAEPRLVPAFLAIDAETLPKKMRRKARAKQIEIEALIKVHDAKKAGSVVMPVEGCTERQFVHPLEDAELYERTGFEEISEDDLRYIMDKTKCSEIDLGCRFTMKIFYRKGRPRRVMLASGDPVMSLVAEARGKAGGNSRFFGMGLTCMH